MAENKILYAFRFRDGQATVIVRVDEGELHAFQRLGGLDDFDLGAIPGDSRMCDGPPTWNPLVEVVPEDEL